MKKSLIIVKGNLPQPKLMERVRAGIERAKIDSELATRLSFRSHTFEEVDALMAKHVKLETMKDLTTWH